MRDIADHRGDRGVLNVLQPGIAPGIAVGQQREAPGVAEEAVVAVEPDWRRRKAIAGNEGEL